MICGFAAGNIAQGGDQPAFADQHAQVEPCGGPLGRAVVQGDGITQCRETPATERKAEAGARRVRPMRLVVAAVMEPARSEEHTSELQSLMRISYAVFCLKKKKKNHSTNHNTQY